MNPIYSLLRRIENGEPIAPETLNETRDALWKTALEDRNARAFGGLVALLGREPETDDEKALYERYQTDKLAEERLDAENACVRNASDIGSFSARDRRGTFIASTVGGFRREISKLALQLGLELPKGYSGWRKPELKDLYWRLRHQSENGRAK